MSEARAGQSLAEWASDSDEYGRLLGRANVDGVRSLPLGPEPAGSDDPVECAGLFVHATGRDEAVRAERAKALMALAGRETEEQVQRARTRAIEGPEFAQRCVRVGIERDGAGG
jgi:hypothetical protein